MVAARTAVTTLSGNILEILGVLLGGEDGLHLGETFLAEITGFGLFIATLSLALGAQSLKLLLLVIGEIDTFEGIASCTRSATAVNTATCGVASLCTWCAARISTRFATVLTGCALLLLRA